jgi:tripartite-type tricarboxylate transporter receptor subunit TctC
MNIRRTLLGAAAIATALATSLAPAHAQDFPTKTITLLVPFPAGGLTDQIARVVGQKLQESLGKTVVVENKPGGGGQIAVAAMKAADADGHTLFIGATEMFAINPELYRKFAYAPLKDFAPITTLVSSPLVLVVPKASPANSVQDVVALAKKKPGGLTFASQGNGSIGHLLGEMFRGKVGGNYAHVAYKGSAPGLQDLMGGQVDLMFDPVITTSPLILSGKLKAIAIASPKRSASLPEVPTLAELGTTGVDASVWFGAVARAGTPAPVVAKLHEAIVKALKSPDVTKRFGDQGLEITPRTPAEFADYMKAEMTRWSALVKASGVSID